MTTDRNELVMPCISMFRAAFKEENQYLPPFVVSKNVAELKYNAALSGNIAELVNAMATWTDMPQGSLYWSNVTANLKESSKIMAECAHLLLLSENFESIGLGYSALSEATQGRAIRTGLSIAEQRLRTTIGT